MLLSLASAVFAFSCHIHLRFRHYFICVFVCWFASRFWDTRLNICQTFWHRLPIFQVDLHCVLHRVATSSCLGHVDELATEPFLLLHREHGTGYWQSWNCCDQRTRFIVIWKHFCFILSTGTRIRIDCVMRPRASSRGRNKSASVTVTVTKVQQFRQFLRFCNSSTETTTTPVREWYRIELWPQRLLEW